MFWMLTTLTSFRTLATFSDVVFDVLDGLTAIELDSDVVFGQFGRRFGLERRFGVVLASFSTFRTLTTFRGR